MATAFIIVQIGNPELDAVCKEAIVPALETCGLEAKRIDKHNQGGLLKSEIIQLIESSDIIIADLTNERPNCYLEVGYAMGVEQIPQPDSDFTGRSQRGPSRTKAERTKNSF